MPSRPRASMASITSMAGRAGLAACDPTGCFCQSCRALSSKGQFRGQSRSVTLGAAANSGMGFTGDGVWRDQWYDTSSSGGRLHRSTAQVPPHWITRMAGPRPHCEGGFPSRTGRYTSYISHALPLGPSHGDLPQPPKGLAPSSRPDGALAMADPGLTFAAGDG